MKIPEHEMTVTNWTQVPAEEHKGETGIAVWRTRRMGDIRIRMVEYSPGYKADHWCEKGHVILCAAGSLEMELADGRKQNMKAGESYHVGDGKPGHRSTTKEGAKLFIVD
ncbi:MAG: DHCW motif cupin fold protein [Terriglobales bacterium]